MGTQAVIDRAEPAPRLDGGRVYRMDLHVHSSASNKPVAAAFEHLDCPESFSPPERVYDLARRRGMDFVTLTDHDTVDGALQLVERGFEGVIVGEEVTVHFPEDRCKLHVLVWDIEPEQHEEIRSLGLRDDVYAFADWLRDRGVPHALAHPLYDQNHRLSLWHLERCGLLFKGFETLNGAHSGAHVATLERWLASLTPGRIGELAESHDLRPRWSRIWTKARTGGSDDHALLNVGRTWTTVTTPADEPPIDAARFIRHVMAGHGTPEGQAGHSALLAHQLMTVGFNFHARRWHGNCSPRGQAIGAKVVRFAGVEAEAPGKPRLAADALKRKLRGKQESPWPIIDSLRAVLEPLLGEYPEIAAALDDPESAAGPALANHERMAEFFDDLTERLVREMASPAGEAFKSFDKVGIINAVLSYAGVLALQLPHMFSLFHQNKERRFLRQIERDSGLPTPSHEEMADSMRVLLFTDTLSDVNGVCRFIRDMGEQAHAAGRSLHIVTSTRFEVPEADYVTNIDPIFATTMPGYDGLELTLPPLLRILRLADQYQPDVIHVSTPGAVGLIGLLAAKMLRVPVVGVYHTDFPAYVEHLFEDVAYTRMATAFMRVVYSRLALILSRSDDYVTSLETIGVDRDRIRRLPPGVALDTFAAEHRDPEIWPGLGARTDSVKVLYVGRVSVEKNLPLLTAAWPEARRRCLEAGVPLELIIVGDGPYREKMADCLAGQDVHFLGFRHGEELSRIYASSDLFVFPSLTDTLGQVVLESQASGLPVIVADQGGPKEVVDEGISGLVLGGEAPKPWTDAIANLVIDREKRERMGRSAQTRSTRYTLPASFENFWQAHLDVVHDPAPRTRPRAAAHPSANVNGAAKPPIAEDLDLRSA